MSPTKRNLERRVDDLAGDRPADGTVIELREEVVRTPWSDDKDDPPEPGATETRIEL